MATDTLLEYYDEHICYGDFLRERPREEFRHLTRDILESENINDLLQEYFHWSSYYSYLTNKWGYVANQLDTKLSNAKKTAVLYESLGSSEKKREASVIKKYSKLYSEYVRADTKYRQYKMLLDLANQSSDIVSRSFTVKVKEVELGV